MKLSIITVNLNNKYGLQKTIDSVISQTYRDFEWIIIDGGSTDGSKELIDKYSNYISYWVSEPDKGIYNAMNKGIKQAHGEYLQFLNSGDIYFEDNTLKQVVKFLINEDIVYGYAVIKNNNTKKRVNIRHEIISCYDLTRNTINHQCAFIKKKLFDIFGLYDENYKIVSDWKFFFDVIAIQKCSTKHINLDIIIYDTTGISQTNSIEMENERREILRLYLPEYAIDDYISRFQINEILRHKSTRFLLAALYRLTIKMEEWNFLH